MMASIKILSRANKTISHHRLRELVKYNPVTGVFTWRKAPSKYKPFLSGMVAGHKLADVGYISIRLDGVSFRAHRLVWLYVYGEWPAKLIDHINGDGSDNRLSNLRLASDIQNKRNQKLRSNNRTGFKGVSFDSRRNKFRARIKTDRQIWLGYFDTALGAHDAYKAAAIKFHGEFARFS